MKIKKEWYLYAAIIIILLLLFLFWSGGEEIEETDDDDSGDYTVPENTVSCTESGSKANLPEGYIETERINWDECCSGFITVTLNYEWDFFFGEEAEECDDDYPVIWTVTDSAGNDVFESEEYVPGSSTEQFRGYWDCLNPWEIDILNQCVCSEEGTFPSITLEWEMTMVCD